MSIYNFYKQLYGAYIFVIALFYKSHTFIYNYN